MDVVVETTSHKRTKGHAAGRSGETEKKIKYGGRIDVLTPTKAVEIERGGGGNPSSRTPCVHYGARARAGAAKSTWPAWKSRGLR